MGLSPSASDAIDAALADPFLAKEVKDRLNKVGPTAATVTINTVSYTTNDPSFVAGGSTTIANGSAPTVVELLDLILEVREVVRKVIQ